jgi:Lipid A 3-O-deacylase (PagL)
VQSDDRKVRFAPSWLLSLAACIALQTGLTAIPAQRATQASHFTRRNTIGIFGTYSPNSSHILLGDARNRKLLSSGVSYDRRLFLNRIVDWQYSAEFAPVALESDPVQTLLFTATSTDPPITLTGTYSGAVIGKCAPFSDRLDLSGGNTETITGTCGRQWTMGEALSPVGFRWSFLPAHRLQPFLDGHGGYIYTTQPIPLSNAGSFNFTFGIGSGVELYYSNTRSIRAEYRYHHISNDNTATANPGIDNGLIQVTYCFSLGH